MKTRATDMAQREAEKLLRELDSVAGRRGPCLPRALKERATRWIVERRATGATVAELASELGLASGTVLRWSADAKTAKLHNVDPAHYLREAVRAADRGEALLPARLAATSN